VRRGKMKAKIILGAMVLLLSAFTGSVYGEFQGNSNTFYGIDAGNAPMGDDDGATFIGANAGTSNTSGYNNTFIGGAAGYRNTTGFYNTFIGYYTGANNIAGSYNTFVGEETGGSNSGSDNTFIGYRVGIGNTGNRNAFVGRESGLVNTSGYDNTFLGHHSGYSNNTGFSNTYVGSLAGSSNTDGYYNTCLGYAAGDHNTTGNYNTFLGFAAGRNNITGYGNVFLGYRTGQNETGSNKLYIANSSTSTPLIYGEFDNNDLTVNGNLEVVGPDNGLVRLSNVTTDNTIKVSRMVLHHYSNTELPVYLFGAASTATDNFVAFGGGNTIGNAATQIDFFTAPNTTTPVGIPRLTIIDNGYVGIGTQTPFYPLQMAGGAYSDGVNWINGSSREYKDNIRDLTTEEALRAFEGLNPVAFNYKSGMGEQHIGFIAEDVPELVATKDRKGLSPMDIVAVLTKVVKEQQAIIDTQQKTNQEQQTLNFILMKKLVQLEARIEDLQARGNSLPILSQK
jgi:hypothetical protein